MREEERRQARSQEPPHTGKRYRLPMLRARWLKQLSARAPVSANDDREVACLFIVYSTTLRRRAGHTENSRAPPEATWTTF